MSIVSRRQWLAAAGLSAAASLGSSVAVQAAEPSSSLAPPKWRFALNAATIRGQQLGIVEQIDVAAAAGYDSYEPWISDLAKYRDEGGSLPDLKKRIAAAGLTIDSAIGFAPWIVDDDAQRAAALEQAKREMELVAAIGGTGIAAPPAGAVDQTDLSLAAAAERYGALLHVGEEVGVVPQLELWGFSKSLSRLGQLMYIATEAAHPQACVMPDVYHIYKGGSDFAGLNLIAGSAIRCFHVNDYPAEPPRAEMTDAHRVYPGDGVAPLDEIFRTLQRVGFAGVLSLELFNRDYWQQPAGEVARTGLRKMQDAVARAFAS